MKNSTLTQNGKIIKSIVGAPKRSIGATLKAFGLDEYAEVSASTKGLRVNSGGLEYLITHS